MFQRFERKILSRIYGPIRDPLMDLPEYGQTRNKHLYREPDIVQEIKAPRLRWAGRQPEPQHSTNKPSLGNYPVEKRSRGHPRLK